MLTSDAGMAQVGSHGPGAVQRAAKIKVIASEHQTSWSRRYLRCTVWSGALEVAEQGRA